MDYRFVSAFLMVCVLALVFYVVSAVPAVETVVVDSIVYPVDGLAVTYLYPIRCVDCDLNVAGQCDFCNSYYDIRSMDVLSHDVGVPLSHAVSDVVDKPALFLVSEGKSTLGDARSKVTIANNLCRFAKVQKSCDLFTKELENLGLCVGGYGIGENTLIYHTSSGKCNVCGKTDPIADELAKLDFNDTVKYSVYTVDHNSADGKQLISECLGAFNNINYAPQLLCPNNGADLTGQFTLSEAREFADVCMGFN